MLYKILLALVSIAAQYGIVGADGQPAEFWKNAAVIYADVVSVEKTDAFKYRIRLKPLATLSGSIDAVSNSEITILQTIGLRELTNIEHVPRVGGKVIVLIEFDDDPRKYFVLNGHAAFFPTTEHGNAPCMFEVTGFDDPKVTETIENLRKLRGKQREEAEKAKAEQEPAAEKKPAEKKSQPERQPTK